MIPSLICLIIGVLLIAYICYDIYRFYHPQLDDEAKQCRITLQYGYDKNWHYKAVGPTGHTIGQGVSWRRKAAIRDAKWMIIRYTRRKRWEHTHPRVLIKP